MIFGATITDIVFLLYAVVTALIGVMSILAFVVLVLIRRVRQMERTLRYLGLVHDSTYPQSRERFDTFAARTTQSGRDR